MEWIELLESEVRSYVRSFPTVFKRARGWHLIDENGTEYIDFFAGAGALNYGHNEPRMKEALMDYLADDGIVHSLDKATVAKREFMLKLNEVLLQPRGLKYKIQFPGPTGTNAVEAALKLARKITGRQQVVSFTNAFHGMTLGALAVTGNAFKRAGAGIPLTGGVAMPYDGFLGPEHDHVAYLEAYLQDKGSGVDRPAAVILETLQGEGGLNTASTEWLRGVEDLCRRYEIPLIVDDVQAGCGRTGPFFSFERAGIVPDIVCLSKSLSGFGLPLAVTLIRPDFDVWEPGEHNATFRGHNPAFVTGAAAMEQYWKDDALSREVARKGELLRAELERIVADFPELNGQVRGLGLFQGIAVNPPGLGKEITFAAFQRGVVMETSGPEDQVIKVMPPLTIDDAGLSSGLEILREAIAAVLEHRGRAAHRHAAQSE